MILPTYKCINLTDGEISNYPISKELFENYIGGKILGSKILYDLSIAGVDPLSPESVLIINTGPANGTGAPSSSRFNMSFKNVLTGGIASSNCGGPFGMQMKRAGIDGVIITGKSPNPITIEILDGDISLRDASHLAGLDTEEVQEKFDEKWGKLVIGPAGERLVKYACAVSGERVAGRCGAGAVMGSKNIKAVVAFGTKKADIDNKDKLTKCTSKWVKMLKSHPMTGYSLPTFGTAGLVTAANASGALPTHNFKHGRYKNAPSISGENLAENYITRNAGCVSCPIHCARMVMVNDKEVKGPEYETVGLFGSNIENDDLNFVNEMNYYADIWGMDTISLAGTIAFAMELQEKNMADFNLKFGDTDYIKDIMWKIANREGIYSELANGSKWLAEKYGGKEFAIHAKGLELAAYEPRHSVGMGLGYATSNRGGCHLNGGYLALFESIGVLSVNKQSPKSKAELTVFFQNMLEAISAAGFCLFTAQAVVPSALFKLGPAHPITRMVNKVLEVSGPVLRPIWKLMPKVMPFNSMLILPQAIAIKNITGLKMTIGRFLQIGERGYNVERLFNFREGLTSKDDSLPARLTNELQEEDKSDSFVPLDKMLPMYYKVRGWNEEGYPTIKKLTQLSIT